MDATNSNNIIAPPRRNIIVLLILLISFSGWGKSAVAQTCGEDYEVKSADSLSKIANVVYGDIQKWSVIYNVNLDVIGDNPNLILVGQKLRIPCLDAQLATESSEASTESTTAAADSDSNASTTTNESDSTGTNAAATDTTTSESETANADSVSTEAEETSKENTTASATVTPATNKPDADGNVIRFLTGGDYAPFTDRNLPNDGLITDVVTTALLKSEATPGFEISWIDDWSLHLNELLPNLEYDMGFPWFKPDCESTPDEFRCQNYEFSNPVFEMLILLFTHKDRPLVFNNDADIAGSILCRPNGYFTHDLEKEGRLWITNNVIELKQPDTIKDCFDMLVDGSVDAVALNEFTGRTAIANFSLKDQVEALENRPLSVEGLRVVVHKSHPRAQELIEIVNGSMAELQLSDEYNTIIDTHFREYWSTID